MYSNTKPFNATGHPATSIPCGWSSNDLPVGLMLVGRRFEDATPLRLANAYQTAFGDPAF
jgi:Asp-tRNA(Asn)/Glu-tRNA(Gln) amidotransferase A subunit family amidase